MSDDASLHVAGPGAACEPPLDLQDYLGQWNYENHLWQVGDGGMPQLAHRYDAHLGWQQWCHLCGVLLQPRSEWIFEGGALVEVDVHGMWQPYHATFWERFGIRERLCLPDVAVDPLPGPEFLQPIEHPDPELVRVYGRPYPVLSDLDPDLRSTIFRRPE